MTEYQPGTGDRASDAVQEVIDRHVERLKRQAPQGFDDLEAVLEFLESAVANMAAELVALHGFPLAQAREEAVTALGVTLAFAFSNFTEAAQVLTGKTWGIVGEVDGGPADGATVYGVIDQADS